MKLPGWCYRCRRVKQVNVSFPPANGVAVGVCDDCRDQDTRRNTGRATSASSWT